MTIYDLGRREVMRSGALAAAAGIRAGAAHGRIVWGCNRGVWESFDAVMPAGLQRSVRIYYDYGEIPQSCSTCRTTDASQVAALSSLMHVWPALEL